MSILDQYQELIAATRSDPGHAFSTEAIAALAELKESDLADYERVRTELKAAGVRVQELDAAIRSHHSSNSKRPSQADKLLEMAEAADLFHTPDSVAFADVSTAGHRATWQVRARGFKQWLTHAYFEETGSAPCSEAMSSAVNAIEARACFSAEERHASLRVAGQDGRIFLDLTDAGWRAVEIDATGWRVIQSPSTRFRRTRGMLPLPEPKTGGSIDLLRSFLNVREEDFALVVAWMLAALRDRGPYPVLVLSGEQGSAKSTFTEIVRRLLDPHTVVQRSLPREDRELFVAATNGHLLTYDNVSGLPAWLSDTFCRLATGGGFAVRQLYTDQEEVLFDATRPIVLNGIEDFVTRPDLADRSIVLQLEPIDADRRRPLDEIQRELEEKAPFILGALLDAVSTGLRCLGETRLETLPRMADFALWASSCERGLWAPGTFLEAYERNRREAVDTVIESDPVSAAIRSLLQDEPEWSGTATGLGEALKPYVSERVQRSKSWPGNPRGLSARLRRCATFLRSVGIDVDYDREGKVRHRILRLTRRDVEDSTAGNGETEGRTQTTEADANDFEDESVCVRPNLPDDLDLELGGRSGRKNPVTF